MVTLLKTASSTYTIAAEDCPASGALQPQIKRRRGSCTLEREQTWALSGKIEGNKILCVPFQMEVGIQGGQKQQPPQQQQEEVDAPGDDVSDGQKEQQQRRKGKKHRKKTC
jgi:hypothetical protein